MIDIPFIRDVEFTVVHHAPFSDSTRLHVLSWIMHCDTAHKCCRKTEFLPSRLLDIRDLDRIELRELADDQGTGRHHGHKMYAALSHCWGTSPRKFLTTKATLSWMKSGFPLSSDVPQTFSDAIIVARSLGIPYLWIDSLCIIQDDVSDWAVEASRMANVYSNVYLTIAAVDAGDDNDGFLKPRPSLYAKVEITSPIGEVCPLYLHREHIRNSSLDSPLFRRGWVLQEQFLPRRTVCFSADKIS